MKFLAFIGRNRTLLEEIYYTFATFGELSDNYFLISAHGYKPVFSAISIIINRNILSVLGKKSKKQDSESTSTCTAELC